VLSFELAGGIEAVRRFTQRLRLCRLVEHVGSVETLLTHPATMTHADVPAEERASVGLTDGLLRLSVGLEPVEHIIQDLSIGFSESTQAASRRGDLAYVTTT
jgi:cystathionine beta-lyase/cystathionine gamma-synthase